MARLPGRARWWLVLEVEVAILVAACREGREGALTCLVSIAGPSPKQLNKPVWQTNSAAAVVAAPMQKL